MKDHLKLHTIMKMFKQDKRLGTTQQRRKYDLPLNKSAGTSFLVMLIALMTFLIVLTLAGSLAVQSLTNTWTSGLENRATIEIPAEKSDGSLRTPKQIQHFTNDVAKSLKKNQDIADFNIMTKAEISELVSPWLGDDMVLDEIPLPQLIALEIKKTSPETIARLNKDLALINDNIRLDTHETWLVQLLRMTNMLQFSGLFIVLIIGITTITAIAGGIRSRMAIYRADIELLHLMGASDEYITKQFQRHALIISAKGSIIGAALAFLGLFTISAVQVAGLSALPSMSGYTSMSTTSLLLLTPAAACIVSMITARTTVLRELAQMP